MTKVILCSVVDNNRLIFLFDLNCDNFSIQIQEMKQISTNLFTVSPTV